MIRVAMLFDYPLPELGSELGVPPGWHHGSYPMRNLVSGLIAASKYVHVDMVTNTKLLPGTHTLDMGERLQLHILGVPKFSGMPVAFIPRIRLLHRYLERLEPDIVHGQGTEREWGISAVTSRFPNVLTVHGILREVHKVNGPSAKSYRRIGRWMESIAFRKARHVIAISPYVRRVLASFDQARFYSVPNAVGPVFFEKEKKVPSGKIVYSALIGVHKGFGDLLQSAKRLQDKGVAAQWAIVGKPGGGGNTYFEQCMAWAKRALDMERFEFPGWLTQEAFAEELREARCLVHPSYCENSPMVIAEAMASGTPAVAYGVGGIPDLIEDGVNGFVVPPGNIDLLTERVRTLVLDPELAMRMGEKAREKAQGFRPEVVAEKTLRVYEHILEREAGTAKDPARTELARKAALL